MRVLFHVLALLPLSLAAACGDGGGACGSGRALTIVEPADGETFTAADDLQPGGTIDIDVVVRACGFTPTDQVVLELLEPVMSDYGFMFAETELLTYRVPLLPGANRLRARDEDRTVMSGAVAVTANPM